MEKRSLICIGCPMGCPLTVEIQDNGEVMVSGNTCPRGAAYGKKEVTNPTRIVTSSVRVENGNLGMVSCKTSCDIPKGKIFDVVRALKDISVPAPVTIGQVLVQQVAGTEADIVATKNVYTAIEKN